MTERKPLFFSRPKDKSLEAFKAWINEMAQKLGVKQSDKKSEMTEEEWVESWKKFWKM